MTDGGQLLFYLCDLNPIHLNYIMFRLIYALSYKMIQPLYTDGSSVLPLRGMPIALGTVTSSSRETIPCVIIHRLLKRASVIGCHKCSTMLISMMEVANRTMDAARYCLPFCSAKSHMCAISLKTFHGMVFNFGLYHAHFKSAFVNATVITQTEYHASKPT